VTGKGCLLDRPCHAIEIVRLDETVENQRF